ncbi:hypothetical protein F4802DRAFT_87526 [Xylaria palmicola]|nr:hypothetical protein F4802DRAFT_87526 [Xylaria palmicola]
MNTGTLLDGAALTIRVYTKPRNGMGRVGEAAFSIPEAGAAVVVFTDMSETTAKAWSEESKK